VIPDGKRRPAAFDRHGPLGLGPTRPKASGGTCPPSEALDDLLRLVDPRGLPGVDLPPGLLRADRPFVFVIRDARSGGIPLLGRVVDPSEGVAKSG